MSSILALLVGTLLLLVAPSSYGLVPTAPGEIKTIQSWDLNREIDHAYPNAKDPSKESHLRIYLQLCAKEIGEKGKATYGHQFSPKLTRVSPKPQDSCKTIEIRSDRIGDQGDWDPKIDFSLMHFKSTMRAHRLYLLSDGWSWYLYVSYGGGNSWDVEAHHRASVFMLNYIPENNPPINPRISIHLLCEAQLQQLEDCETCYLAKDKGINEFRPPEATIRSCAKVLDTSLIHWTKAHQACFIDYSICIK